MVVGMEEPWVSSERLRSWGLCGEGNWKHQRQMGKRPDFSNHVPQSPLHENLSSWPRKFCCPNPHLLSLRTLRRPFLIPEHAIKFENRLPRCCLNLSVRYRDEFPQAVDFQGTFVNHYRVLQGTYGPNLRVFWLNGICMTMWEFGSFKE